MNKKNKRNKTECSHRQVRLILLIKKTKFKLFTFRHKNLSSSTGKLKLLRSPTAMDNPRLDFISYLCEDSIVSEF